MTVMTYKGYAASIAFDPDDLLLVGRVLGISDGVGFHGETGPAAITAFHEAVDDYLETCARIGKAPEKPYSGKVMFRIPPAVHAQAAAAAALAGKSLNAWGAEALRRAAERAVGADR